MLLLRQPSVPAVLLPAARLDAVGEQGTLLRLSRVMGYDACAMCSALASSIYMAWHSLTGVLGWVQGVWRGSLGWAGWQAPGGTVQATAALH